MGRSAPLPATRPSPSAATADLPAGRRGARHRGPGRPVAIANGRFGNRPHCIYRGFCLQGCKVNAKASPLITHIPDALAHGAEIRANCMVTRIEIEGDRSRRGVDYFHDGVEHFQRARRSRWRATPSRPPASCCSRPVERFPDGLCNDDGQVGRYFMVQGAPQTAGRFDDEIRMYKAPPPEVSYRGSSTKPIPPSDTDAASPSRNLPAPHHLGRARRRSRALGEVLREYMRDYVHWATLGALCEFSPSYDNAVTLAEETDRHGLPVAKFSYSQCDNDRAHEGRPGVMEDLPRRPAPKR